MAEPGREPIRPGNAARNEDMAENNPSLTSVPPLRDDTNDKLNDHDVVLEEEPQLDPGPFGPSAEDITALRTMADIARAGTQLPPTEGMGRVDIRLRRMAEVEDTMRIIELVPDLEVEDVQKLKNIARHLDELSNLSEDELSRRIASGAEDETIHHTFEELDNIKIRCQQRRAVAAAHEARQQQK